MGKKKINVMEMLDQLSTMAEMDLAPLAGKEAPFQEWINSAKAAPNQEKVKETFRAINSYLKELYEEKKEDLQDPKIQRGIQAIMLLAGEAAQKMDKYTTLFKGTHGVSDLKEYKDLQEFYLTKILQKFKQSLEAEEAWQAEWKEASIDVSDIERRGLKDLETVRRDKEYELFTIRKEDGSFFFNRNLLRHIQLVGEFDEAFKESSGETPFLQLQEIQDREIQLAAKELLVELHPYMEAFFKEAMHHKEEEAVAGLSKALMALMLAANSQNLSSHARRKSCFHYYSDFQAFLRQALASSDYQKRADAPLEKREPFDQALLRLTQMLCFFFFQRPAFRKETMAWIHRIIQKPKGLRSGPFFWHDLLNSDEEIRAYLKKFPSGPLLKTLEILREQEEMMGFDPIAQGNFPYQLFTFLSGQMHVSCLHLPTPTRQEFIHEVECVEEFLGFLRALSLEGKQQKHLLINLQDRTSWQEHARSVALEQLQKEKALAPHLGVVTLPKHTDFYFQAETFEKQEDAAHFIEQFKEQISKGEGCGFYLPFSLHSKEIIRFIDQAMETIHDVFFEGKNILTRKNRLDFIEIFYHFFVLKLSQVCEADLISFTSKDGIDTGASSAAGFYAFARLLSDLSPWSEEERGFLLWTLYAPALMLRNRAIDQTTLHRFISAMTVLQAELESGGRKALEKCQALYRLPPLKVAV